MANLPISPLYIKQTLPREDTVLPGAIVLFGALSVTSQFKVSLHLADGPTGLNKWLTDSGVIIASDKQKNLFYDFFCAEASLPGVIFDTADEFGSRQGVLEKFPTKKVFTDFTITLYVDNQYQNIRLFEEWMNYINPINTSNGPVAADPRGQGGANLTTDFFRVRYPDSYRKIISISKFERDFYIGGKTQPTTLTYRMIDAYPTNITPIPVTYEGSQILKTTISFTYSRYILEKYIEKKA